MTFPRPAAVVVLAAGEGTRMRSATPKVLHTLAGRSMLGHALATARALDPGRVLVVVRHERELVARPRRADRPAGAARRPGRDPRHGPRGPGRDVGPRRRRTGRRGRRRDGRVGDARPGQRRRRRHRGRRPAARRARRCASCSRRTTRTATPSPCSPPRSPTRPATAASCASPARATCSASSRTRTRPTSSARSREINSSIYVFDADVLRGALGRLGRDNAQGEVYLTDVLAIARTDGGHVRALRTDDPILVEGVNDRVQLGRAARRDEPPDPRGLDARRRHGRSTRRPPGSTSTSSSSAT